MHWQRREGRGKGCTIRRFPLNSVHSRNSTQLALPALCFPTSDNRCSFFPVADSSLTSLLPFFLLRLCRRVDSLCRVDPRGQRRESRMNGHDETNERVCPLKNTIGQFARTKSLSPSYPFFLPSSPPFLSLPFSLPALSEQRVTLCLWKFASRNLSEGSFQDLSRLVGNLKLLESDSAG